VTHFLFVAAPLKSARHRVASSAVRAWRLSSGPQATWTPRASIRQDFGVQDAADQFTALAARHSWPWLAGVVPKNAQAGAWGQ